MNSPLIWLAIIAYICLHSVGCSTQLPTQTFALESQTNPKKETSSKSNFIPVDERKSSISLETLNPTIQIGNVTFKAELASTVTQQNTGLSGRESLPSESGMLFMAESNSTFSFWMLGMNFPLDFVWISKQCLVVDITHQVSIPEPRNISPPIHTSRLPAAYNFEINSGEATQLGLMIGDSVKFSGMPDQINKLCG